MTDPLQKSKGNLRARTPQSQKSARFAVPWNGELPVIDTAESFDEIVAKLMGYFRSVIDAAYSYEQLRLGFAGRSLKPLVLSLSGECHHPAIVAALLATKYCFQEMDDEGTGLSESRGFACEIVAWQLLTYLSEGEIIDYLLYEVPDQNLPPLGRKLSTFFTGSRPEPDRDPDEHTPLLESSPQPATCDSESGNSAPASSPAREPWLPPRASIGDAGGGGGDSLRDATNDNALRALAGMNALEVAGIVSAKRFLGQRLVQAIIDDIWCGNVVFWESLSVEAKRKPRTHNKKVTDPFIRLRVPKYQKAFQIGFFVTFLALFYTVLVGPVKQHITLAEGLLYWWMAAFAYDEFGDIQDTGMLFYKVDFWSLWDVGIIVVSTAFVALRIYGIVMQSGYYTGMSFDILSMVAVFLVPRIFSVMSINPYFGSLIPVLKEMTKAFCKFLPVIVVLYLGFLTTFTMLAREHLAFREVSWTLLNVFFGSTFLGFISPHFGFPLMLVFVCLTNIVLITSLVSLVSNSVSEIMAHARDEHLFQYSIYVLESSSSRRLTYFMPPLNLIPLLLIRPLRLILPSEHVRRVRIVVLKATHVGFIALIGAYEGSVRLVARGNEASAKVRRDTHLTPRPLSASVQIEFDRYAQRPCPPSTLTAATPLIIHPEPPSGIADADIVELIRKMSAQIDELTAMVAEQRSA